MVLRSLVSSEAIGLVGFPSLPIWYVAEVGADDGRTQDVNNGASMWQSFCCMWMA